MLMWSFRSGVVPKELQYSAICYLSHIYVFTITVEVKFNNVSVLATSVSILISERASILSNSTDLVVIVERASL
jgi:hypothetical protein